LVEYDHAVEVIARPGEDLVEAGRIVSARTQGRVSHEENALSHGDGAAEFPGSQRLDVDRQTTKRSPVAPGIFQQRFILRNPDMAAFPAHPAIENDAGNLSALAGARSIPKEIALPV